MFAKIIGVVTCVIVFMLYFKWRSADPVLETMIGICFPSWLVSGLGGRRNAATVE